MARRKTSKSNINPSATAETDAPSNEPHLASLFRKANRGLLLDVIVFIANIFLMQFLTKQFLGLFTQVSAEEPLAKFALGLTFLAMWILPAAGAILKRWHYHQRLQQEKKTAPAWDTKFSGCLFNPIFYFCLNLVITSAVLTSLGDFLFGKALLQNGALFVPFVIAGFLLTVAQTFIIYRYFSAPKSPPNSKFLLSPESETLGDACFFLNMLLFQVFWNMLTFAGLGHPTSVLEFFGRLYFLCFIALLIYFPPRMFYLAEDIHRGRTWLMMLLANSPVIIRVLIGTGSEQNW